MKIQIGKDEHRVVYIDYQNGIPHSVKTIFYVPVSVSGPYWRITDWDFFLNNGDESDLRAYECGSGGSHKKIQAPQYVDGYMGKYWLAKDAKFKGKPKNARRLKNPVKLKNHWIGDFKFSKNPFKIAEITNSHEYCEVCEHSSTEFCYEHKYDDKNGDTYYKHDNSPAN